MFIYNCDLDDGNKEFDKRPKTYVHSNYDCNSCRYAAMRPSLVGLYSLIHLFGYRPFCCSYCTKMQSIRNASGHGDRCPLEDWSKHLGESTAERHPSCGAHKGGSSASTRRTTERGCLGRTELNTAARWQTI